MITAEDLEQLTEAREEFITRASSLRTSEEADALRAWAVDVNADLDDVAYELGDGPALNTEAITTWLQLEAG